MNHLYSEKGCFYVSVCLSLLAITHHEIQVGTCNFVSSFAVILGCSMPNMIKICP